jgi:hypothetical protein
MREKKTIDKEALKKLRQERGVWVEKAKKTIQVQSKVIKQIKAQIADDGKTIPEIAQATGLPTSQVLLFVSGLKKYGDIAEADKDGDYFKYRRVS